MADHWIVTVINDIVAPLAPYPLLAGIGWWLWRQGRTQERLRNVEKSVRELRQDIRDLRTDVIDVAQELRKDIRALSQAMYQPPSTRIVDPHEHTNENRQD